MTTAGASGTLYRMPAISRDSAAHIQNQGPVEYRHDDINGYTIGFVSFAVELDGTPLLKGLPDDLCHCPHWGYVFKGSTTFHFADHDETFVAGDAFYVPPGHAPHHSAGNDLLLFSPSDALAETDAVMMRNMGALAEG